MKVQIMEKKTWEKVSRETEMENSMTYVLNRYLVMDRRLHFPVSLDEIWTNYPS
jgi:hypothetical protein